MTALLAAYTWDSRSNQYVDSKGKFVSRAKVKGALDGVIEAASAEIEEIARKLQAGEIGQPEWFLETAKRIKTINIASGAVATGGTHALTPSVLGSVAARVKSQYQFLRDFAREIANGLPLDGRFLARAASYGHSGRPTFEAIARKADLAAGMAFERRILHPAEHCGQCVDQAAMGWQEAGVLLPIGDCTCMNHCRCTFERSRTNPDARATPRASARPRPMRTADRRPTVAFAEGDIISNFSFARSAKTGGIAAVAQAVAQAVTGTGSGFNGTVGGKRGFQPGNKFGGMRKAGTAVQKASGAHRAARNAFNKHVNAGTHGTRAGLAAQADLTRKAQVLHQAKADSAVSNAIVAGKASSLSGPRPLAPSPMADRVASSAKATDAMKVDRATNHLHDLHAGVKGGVVKPEEIHGHVDRIARGTTKGELFDAAKAHGVETKGIKTKGALVEHLKENATALVAASRKPGALGPKAQSALRESIASQGQPQPAPHPAQAHIDQLMAATGAKTHEELVAHLKALAGNKDLLKAAGAKLATKARSAASPKLPKAPAEATPRAKAALEDLNKYQEAPQGVSSAGTHAKIESLSHLNVKELDHIHEHYLGAKLGRTKAEKLAAIRKKLDNHQSSVERIAGMFVR